MTAIQVFQKRLLEWYQDNRRTFSWRETRNPYCILLSEVLLQKTNAQKVQDVYDKIVSRYPTLEELAKSRAEELTEMLMPLGLQQKRSSRLRSIAGILVEESNGEVPRGRDELLALPGVGDYVANAVLCLAYGEELPLLDTNIIRILQRVFNMRSLKSRPRTDSTLWAAAREMIPEGKAREFNLGMLDFAAQVCTARNPKCSECTVSDLCQFARR